MARDAGSDDKPGKRRWGRGKAEEGPSDDELGWLADLRGAREERTPLIPDEPTGPVTGRGRRDSRPVEPPASPKPPPAAPMKPTGKGSPPVPAPPATPAPAPPAPPAGRRGRRQERAEPAMPPTPAPPPPMPPPPMPPPPMPPPPMPPPPMPPPPKPPPPKPPPPAGAPPPPAAGGAPPRAGLRRTPAAPPPPVPPVPVIPARGGGSPRSAGPARPPNAPGAGGVGAGPGQRPPGPDPSGWHDLTGEVPAFRDDPPGRPAEARPRGQRTDPRRPAPPTASMGPPTGPIGPPTGAIGPAGGGPDLLVTTGMIKRAEIRRQLRVGQQLKVATLVVVAMLLLLAYPVYEMTRSVAQDPVFGHLDSLSLPDWAAGEHSDAASGSRWCIEQCRFRERTWASEREPDETNLAYDGALRDAGWRPRTDGICPPVEEGTASCWKRDEYVMDMWVRAPICDVPPPRPTISAKPPAGSPAPSVTPVTCPGALITMKVFNAIDYHPVG